MQVKTAIHHTPTKSIIQIIVVFTGAKKTNGKKLSAHIFRVGHVAGEWIWRGWLVVIVVCSRVRPLDLPVSSLQLDVEQAITCVKPTPTYSSPHPTAP